MTEPLDSIDYVRFFRSLPNPYIAFRTDDPVFTIVEENEAHAKIAFSRPETSIGKPTFEVFPDNSEKYKKTGVSDLLESLRKVIRTGKPDLMPLLNYDVRGKDGKFVSKWWRVTHYPLFNATGKVEHVFQATEDITQEIETNNKLIFAQSQLDSALAIGLVSTWFWDVNSDVVIGDKNLAKSFGVKPELTRKGLPLKTFTDSIHEDDRERVIKAIQKCIEKGTIFEEEYRTVSKKKTIHWVIARGKCEKDEFSEAAYMLGILIDITARKQAEEELEETKLMFSALFESTIMSIAMADLDGNILQANKTFLRTFGYTKKELKSGFNSSQITPEQSKKITKEIYTTIRKTGEMEPVEKEYVRKDGTIIPMMVGAARLPNNSNRFMAVMLDISENKELRALNEVKDEFIGMASHQLRTPATAVKQYLSLLRTGFSGDLNEDQQEYADKAYASNERQLDIVNDLLKTAQIDSNRYILRKERVKVVELINHAVEELEDVILSKGQKIEYQHTANNLQTYGDKTELNLVLVNLIENASKYSPRDTKITVYSGSKDGYVTIKVKDQGVGISRENSRRIFQKFTRIDNELSDTVSGTGLGLYWVDRIIRLHGGYVRVVSNPDKGTTFVVSLPYES